VRAFSGVQPWVAFALGFREPPGLRTVLWATSLAFMGVTCLLNAARCGPRSLPLHRAIFHPLRSYFPGSWPRPPAVWTVGVELDWPRNNHRSDRPHLGPRTISRSISTDAMISPQHVYEVRPRKDNRGVDFISDALPFGALWYSEPNAISNANRLREVRQRFNMIIYLVRSNRN
jgi:hypothetical protein